MDSFTLRLDAYQGPLEKLLELIEREELPITQVSIAKVTGDFLAYVRELEERHLSAPNEPGGTGTDPQLVADFLVVASKLILIKSKALLPSLEVTQEEEEEMKDLEERLRLYRELKGAQAKLKAMWNPGPAMLAREFLQTAEIGFYPPPSATPEALAGSLKRLLGELERLWKPTAAIRIEFANLKEKIEEVLKRLTASAETSFTKLAGGRSSGGSEHARRGDLVVLFLAILHLVREQLVRVDQGQHFDDITIAKLDAPPVQ